MGVADEKIAQFEEQVLLRGWREVASSRRIQEGYVADIVTRRPHADGPTEELLAVLAGALRRRAGASLVLRDRAPPADIAPTGGRYVVTTFYEVDGDDVCAAPGVISWMKFNNNLHVFAHRYDNDVAQHRVEDITRPHILNHVLNSFTFFRTQAYAPEPFPGYRGR